MKKPYVVPVVTEIGLLPEEGILSFCRGSVGAARSATRCASAGSCSNRTANLGKAS